MSKFGVLVMGPAGAGKTTFCNALIQHLQNTRRSCFYVNLDPAAEAFSYEPDLDIRELITLEDVMEELQLGPNGGLIYCFEFLLQNLEFLSDALEPLSEEYLILIDMPGQIELYTHIPLLPSLVQFLSRQGPLNINLCAAYLLESTFVIDNYSDAKVNTELVAVAAWRRRELYLVPQVRGAVPSPPRFDVIVDVGC